LTPPGSAAVATIAIVGPNAWSIVRSLFCVSRGAPLPDSPVFRQHWVGQFGPPPGDNVVVSVRQLGPMPWIEINCHGGSQVVRWILSELRARGAATVSGTELVEKSGRSPLQAAAEIELTQTVTLRTAAILLDQFHGALDRELETIKLLLKSQECVSAQQRLSELLQFADVGRHLNVPWRIVVAGPPNVGKSSLINRLVGYPRCVVAPLAGTTRDLVSTAIAIEGWPVELIDTAGQRGASNPLESAGVALAFETARSADLVLWLFDSESPTVPDSFMKVRNKMDLAPHASRDQNVIPISALTGEGLGDLLMAIAKRLVPFAPTGGVAVPFNAKVAAEIEHAANRLKHGDVLQCVAILERLTQGE
jgi:tRNA modification GTPase